MFLGLFTSVDQSLISATLAAAGDQNCFIHQKYANRDNIFICPSAHFILTSLFNLVLYEQNKILSTQSHGVM